MTAMDEVYGSVMSFGKVPCTPVSGAYAAFYDVFGDVDRIGTGSSGDDLERSTVSEKEDEEEGSFDAANCCNYCGRSRFETTSSAKTRHHIDFLQKKEEEILGELHQEIRLLKHENSELKFQIHVILRQDEPPVETSTAYYLGSGSKKAGRNPNDTISRAKVTGNVVSDRERTLELELESATKMIEELKWVQQHFDKKIRHQEVKIDDLERQLALSNNGNFKVVPIRVTSPLLYQSTKADNNRTRPHSRSSRQRSSSEHQEREVLNRRSSLQSLLPDDYKERVATLPPILAPPLSSSCIRAALSTAPSTASMIKKQNDNCGLTTKGARHSSHIQSANHNILRNPSTFPRENANQQGNEAQFYFSK